MCDSVGNGYKLCILGSKWMDRPGKGVQQGSAMQDVGSKSLNYVNIYVNSLASIREKGSESKAFRID